MKVSPLLLHLWLAIAALTVHAATYDIGPGWPKTMLKDVPWATLQPGDLVNIHVKPGGYHEKIQISESGTASGHIVIHGVPDPVTGALPVIDAKDAVEDPSIDWRNAVFSPLGLIVVSPRAAAYSGRYGIYHTSFVDIENLDLRNALYTADGSITYTDQHGAVRGYDGFACGIYIEWAHDLAIRGCEISYCCNGIFANSKNLAAQSSARLLIEHNYFHDNSLPYTTNPSNPAQVISNGYHEHHCYIESAGVIYQYNRFGPLRPGCHGVAIKDRSSGQIIRYNEFDMLEESNVLALIDPQGGYGWIDTQPDYKDSYVYGNLMTIENYTSSISAIWWGAYNGTSSYGAEKRGVLHFFHNTVVNHHSGISLFFLPSTTYTGAAVTVNESVDCRNNVFFADSSIQSSSYTAMCFSTPGATNGGGNITLGANWISPGWRKDSPGHAYEGMLTGTTNLLNGDSTGANNPRFVDVTARDYHVLNGSNILDAAGPLAAGDPVVAEEYRAPQSSVPRAVLGAASDLGAVESSGTPPPPPPGGAFTFSSIAYSVAENAGFATITVNRTGGTTGAVSVVATSSPGSASSPADFSAASAVLSWPSGDATPRTFSVAIVNDATTELTETINLTLSNPTGGSALGVPAQATLTIIDDDTPPAQPIVGITASGQLIRFTSGAPGTLLGSIPVTGLATGETIRGLAFRRSTGQLYAVGGFTNASGQVGSASVYTLNPATGAATKLSDITATLAHVSFDLGFDPVMEQLRIFGSTGQNLRINPATGAVLAVDTAFAFAAGDANFGSTPGLVGGDYTPGLSPTAYAIDKTLDLLVRVGSAGGSPLGASSGKLTTIGPLGVDTEGHTGLDFAPGGTAFAVLNPATGNATNLSVIDLTSGHATSLGVIGGGEQVRDIVVATPGQISFVSPSFDVTEGDGFATISAARTGGSWGAVSVAFSTNGGSAAAGSDYTATSTTLSWQDGEVGVKSVSVPITNDSLVEGDEMVLLALTNPSGGALLLTPATVVLTIHERPFDQWKLAWFGAAANQSVADPNADPDGDGLPNALEYALGTSPLAANPVTAVAGTQTIGSESYLTLAFTRAAADVTYLVEVSGNLMQPWLPGSRYSPSGDVPINSTTTDITPAGSPPGFTLVRDNTPLAAMPQRFLRLKVTIP